MFTTTTNSRETLTNSALAITTAALLLGVPTLSSAAPPAGQPQHGTPDFSAGNDRSPSPQDDATPIIYTTDPVDMVEPQHIAAWEMVIMTWGSDNPTFDTNNDGIVDVQDLLHSLDNDEVPEFNISKFLSMLAETNAGPAAAQPVHTVAAWQMIQNAWGSNNPELDFNHDGTVDIADLLRALASPSQPQYSINDLLDVLAENTSDEIAQAAPVHKNVIAWWQVLVDFNRTDSRFDTNSDGQIDITDLLDSLVVTQQPEFNVNDLLAMLAETTNQPQHTAWQLIRNAWGTSSSQFDLDNNGVVDVTDLLITLETEQPVEFDVHGLLDTLSQTYPAPVDALNKFASFLQRQNTQPTISSR